MVKLSFRVPDEILKLLLSKDFNGIIDVTIGNTSQSTPNISTPKEKSKHVKIIEKLNKLSCKSYKVDGKAAIALISGRFADGFTLEDFYHVIEVKCLDWKTDPQMQKYLRPSTLFAPKKFEEYLNQPKANNDLLDLMRWE